MKLSHICFFVSIIVISCVLFSREYFDDSSNSVVVNYINNTLGRICPAGSWCPTNTRTWRSFLCPPGSYGNGTGLSSPKCTGLCSPGYYCNAGSTSQKQNICPAGYYCVEGTSNLNGSTPPIVCPPGFYCVAGSSEPKACPAGYYCPEGSENYTTN